MMNSNDIKPVGCAEIYHYNPEPIEYMMYLDHKEVFDTLQTTKFVKSQFIVIHCVCFLEMTMLGAIHSLL